MTGAVIAAVAVRQPGSDRTPAAVDWANISGASGSENSNQTISGIAAPISVTATLSGVSGAGEDAPSSEFVMLVDGVATNVAIATEGGFVGATLGAGQTVRFRGNRVAGAWSATVTVRNVSDSNVVLDTFTINIT